jgi:hypothetical protein
MIVVSTPLIRSAMLDQAKQEPQSVLACSNERNDGQFLPSPRWRIPADGAGRGLKTGEV